MNLTLADIQERIAALERQLADSARKQSDMNAMVILLLSRLGDVTHLTVRETAKALHVSTRTVWRKIRQGDYTLEKKPGTREQGIPIEQVFGGWLSITAAKAIVTASER